MPLRRGHTGFEVVNTGAGRSAEGHHKRFCVKPISLYEVTCDLPQVPHGRVREEVLDAKSFAPVSAAQVFAVADPCDSHACVKIAKGRGSFPTYDDLARAARTSALSAEVPNDRSRLVSQFVADRGTEISPHGNFDGLLAPGVYHLAARSSSSILSGVVGIEVQQRGVVEGGVLAPRLGRLTFPVLDGKRAPASDRVAAVHRFPMCRAPRAGNECPRNLNCNSDFQCRPPFCKSDVVFSRGIDYSIDTAQVDIKGSLATFVDARVYHLVDTRGWVSVDQHVHGTGSPESSVLNPDWLNSALLEGLEVFVRTDHAFIQNLEPEMRQQGLRQSVVTWPEDETSTLDVSHLIGWPLDWTTAESAGGPLGRESMTPAAIFEGVRDHGLLAAQHSLAVLLQPRGVMGNYFDVFGVDPFALGLVQGQIQVSTLLLAPENISPVFDLIEMPSSRRFDIERIPTYAKGLEYNVAMREALSGQEEKSHQEVLRALMPTGGDMVGSMLARTVAEQHGIWGFPGTPQYVLSEEDLGCPRGHACRRLAAYAQSPLPVCMGACGWDVPCGTGIDCIEGWCGDPGILPWNAVKWLSDNWLTLFNHGTFKTGLVGSDPHGLLNFELGSLRNYVKNPTDGSAAVNLVDLVRTYRQERSFVSYGPFVEFEGDWKGPGEVAQLSARKSVTARLRVQSPLWFDVNSVKIQRNGKLEYVFNSKTEDPDRHVELPNKDVVNTKAEFQIPPPDDSWYIAFVMGVDGKPMYPVYGSFELPPVYLGDLFQSVFGCLPIALRSYMTLPKVLVYYLEIPFAVPSSVFLDVDGNNGQGCLVTSPDGPQWASVRNYPKGERYRLKLVLCVGR